MNNKLYIFYEVFFVKGFIDYFANYFVDKLSVYPYEMWWKFAIIHLDCVIFFVKGFVDFIKFLVDNLSL